MKFKLFGLVLLVVFGWFVYRALKKTMEKTSVSTGVDAVFME
jgi:hypothetical protein